MFRWRMSKLLCFKRSWELRPSHHSRVDQGDCSDATGRPQCETTLQRSGLQIICVSVLTKTTVVVINEADTLSRDAQAALRRTMEKYMSNLRIILCANSTSRIIAPIKSRCLLIRVAAPSTEEVNIFEMPFLLPNDIHRTDANGIGTCGQEAQIRSPTGSLLSNCRGRCWQYEKGVARV